MSTGATPSDSGPARFVHHPDLTHWRLAEAHPFRPDRLQALYELLTAWELLDPAQVIAPEPLRPNELERLHDPDYLRAVRRLSRGDAVDDPRRFGLGTADTPIFPGMHDAIEAVCSASVTAVRTILDGQTRRAASFAGGLHHAMPARASGFCIYDDASLAILRATDRDWRVAYLDLDAHHGDGVQQAFYDSDRVLTISVHESGRYLFPGTGHGYELGSGPGRGWSVNLPLEPFTEDGSYRETFERVVPRALEAFAPDLIVLQTGADGHRDDPLADLALSVRGMRDLYRRVVELAERHADGRLLMLGGGGYEPYAVAVRAWAQAWAALTGRDTPGRLPEAWRRRWSERAGKPLPEGAVDDPERWAPQPRRALIRGHNLAIAHRSLAQLEPLWSEAAPRREATEATEATVPTDRKERSA
ncbi:MAG: acetoin utilization protein AcuC [Trueperaceae bacterium]